MFNPKTPNPQFSLSPRWRLSDLSIPQKLSLIIGLFSFVIVALLGLSFFGMEMLSGARAYVGGESLWSKSQKAAIFYLTRYAHSHNEADYQNYLRQIAIPLGDHDARIELQKQDYDFDVVAKGFHQGQNNPADFRTMVFMVRHFYQVPQLHRAIVAWTEADRLLEDLQHSAEDLRQEIRSSRPQATRTQALLDQIRDIDTRLTPLENEFSFALGEGARWLKKLLLLLMVGATILFLILTLTIAYLVARHLSSEIDQLRQGARRIAEGDYRVSLATDSRDEIGDLARTFQAMAAQREEAERLKDEFFANVSHELRTPLTLILSPLESLLSGANGTIDPKARASFEIMHNNAVRLLQLVNGLLDFSKLGAGKMSVKYEPVNISALTQMLYNDFQPLFNDRCLETHLHVHPTNAVVLIDRYLYERILFNLLSNAVKFTSPGGRITVSVQWLSSQMTVSIADTGIGIPRQNLQSIFQRFRQVEGSSTRRFEGTGLGLALVREFAELLGGNVEVQSQPGEGSTFTVKFPAEKADAPTAVTTKALTQRAPQYAPALIVTSLSALQESLPKILIAEDNAEMAAYIASLLQTICHTRIARNGHEALKIVHEWPPDLILTDVMMPHRDGLSVCREIKANPTTASIPVVMLTALTHREALVDGWKAGANEYLFKPFHPQELVIRIQTLLKARKELEGAHRELEAFSYSVSHDLRTPLRAIDGFSREIQDHCGKTLDTRSQSDLQRIRQATQHMSQLIDDLLELSHISRRELKSETVDLAALATDIAQTLRSAEPERQVDFQIEPGLTVTGDAHLLRIALENLLANAWKFTSKQSHAVVTVSVTPARGQNALFVRDNGVGFNMAYAGKLFKPFQRLHDPKEFPGTGIGLALVQRIMHRHGGQIWAESAENQGATFYCALPGLPSSPVRELERT